MKQNDKELITQHMIMPGDLNPNYHIFGGTLLSWLDKDLYIYIANKTRFGSFVTGLMSNIRFKKPAYLGEIIRIFGRIEEIKRSNVIVAGWAVAYNPETMETREIIECIVTFVAVDAKGKPKRIPDIHSGNPGVSSFIERRSMGN